MEEKLNALTHGIGALLSVAALITLSVSAYLYGTVYHMVSFVIYGVTLVLLYLASTLYHSFKDEKLKHLFKIFDHAAIYLLIAGTYTPFTLIALHGTLGWTVFTVIWSVAIVGVILKIFLVKRFKILSTLLYLAMGWFMIVCIKPLIAALPASGLYWLIAGGLLYTVGSFFYINHRVPYNHAVWHLFVLAGSAAHFITVFCYVLPIQVVG